MELRQLRYFIAVGEGQHFRRASELLHVAQPALSRQIKALEKELGVELFERLPRGAQLSDAGHAFLKDAKQILQAVDVAAERMKRIGRGKAGTLRIAFSEVGSWHGVVPDSIRAFRMAEPEVEIFPMTLHSMAQLEALNASEIDAGFSVCAPDDNTELHHCPVKSENVLLALPKTHPLALKSDLKLTDLRDEALIWTARTINPRFFDNLMAACLAGGLVPRIVQEVSHAAVGLSLVASGLGLAMVTSAMRWRLPEEILLRQVNDLSVPTSLELIWRKDSRSPILRRFVQLALSFADPALPPEVVSLVSR